MQDLNILKQLESPETPLFLFECTFASGTVERWGTHRPQGSPFVHAGKEAR